MRHTYHITAHPVYKAGPAFCLESERPGQANLTIGSGALGAATDMLAVCRSESLTFHPRLLHLCLVICGSIFVVFSLFQYYFLVSLVIFHRGTGILGEKKWKALEAIIFLWKRVSFLSAVKQIKGPASKSRDALL